MIVISVALKGREKDWVLTFKSAQSVATVMEALQGHKTGWITDDYGISMVVIPGELAGVLVEDYNQAVGALVARQVANAHAQLEVNRALQRDEKIAAASKLAQAMGAGAVFQGGRA